MNISIMDRPFTRITETIIEHLRRNGYDAQYGNLSETEHGVSEYVVVWKDSKCQKIRISDHSVESRQRMSDEILISINTDENEAAVQCLHEMRIRYDFDKYFERKRVKFETLSSFETPYPMPDDEILSSRPAQGKEGTSRD